MRFYLQSLVSLGLFLFSALPAFAASNNDFSKRKLPVLNQSHPSGHRILSDGLEHMPAHFEYAIIGSGYGASVAALEIAKAEHAKAPKNVRGKIAVLERGAEWLPGDFPENPLSLAAAVRSSMNPLGLIDSNTDEFKADLDVIGANALGGTSQLNAAITLRPPSNVWEQSEWPEEIRKDFASGELEQDFQSAEAMLRPNHGPFTRTLPKTAAHLGNFPDEVPTGELTLNINHEQDREFHGVKQNACTNCGNCCGGCNVGAKNTLTTNYLPYAKDLGAMIFTQVEIDYFEALGGDGITSPRYLVHFTAHRKDSLGVTRSLKSSFTANHLILGAGSAGSTKILMKSREKGLKLSSKLGSRVSANGDVLGFVYNGKIKTNIAAYSDTKVLTQEGQNPVGQTITAYGDYRAVNIDGPLSHQFVLLDGAVPRAFATEVSRIMRTFKGAGFLTSASALLRIGKDIICQYPSPNGAFNHSMMLLACGHDSSGGEYVLDKDGKIYVTWSGVRDEESFQYINQKMKEYADRLGGTFIYNPRSTFWGGRKIQATHPLGGAPMGESVETGVVNHSGQVFNPEGGLYEGLYVVDAAIIPRSLAAPPLITITALAHRAMRHFTKARFSPCEKFLKEAKL